MCNHNHVFTPIRTPNKGNCLWCNKIVKKVGDVWVQQHPGRVDLR